MAGRVAIVGVGQTRHASRRDDVSLPEMVGEAVRAALADAQLSVKDIEAFIFSNMEAFEGILMPDHGMIAEVGATGKTRSESHWWRNDRIRGRWRGLPSGLRWPI